MTIIIIGHKKKGLAIITSKIMTLCVFSFTSNRYFYPSISSATTSVRADSSILLLMEEIQVIMWSQSYATEILLYVATYQVCGKHSSRQCNAMPSQIILDTKGTTYTFYEIDKRKETIT